MEVLGRDSAREAYRVAVDGTGRRIVGLIPDAVISRNMRLTGGRGHQTAYEWLSRNSRDIETALHALREGRKTLARPFDQVVLEEDA